MVGRWLLLAIGFVVSSSASADSSISERCNEMVRRFDTCLITTYGANEMGLTTAQYLNRFIPHLLDTISGENLTALVQPASEFEQDNYLGRNLFRNCHDYNTFETCLDFQFGQCLTNNFSANKIFNFIRSQIRRHGGERYQAVRFSDRLITDVAVAMDFLCARKMGHLDKYRTCLLGVFLHNKALGFDAMVLSKAMKNGVEWTPRLCNQTQRFFNSLTFAIRRNCEADFTRDGPEVATDVFDTLQKMFALSIEANENFSPQKCRLFASPAPANSMNSLPQSSAAVRPSKSSKSSDLAKANKAKQIANHRAAQKSSRPSFMVDDDDGDLPSTATGYRSQPLILMNTFALLIIPIICSL